MSGFGIIILVLILSGVIAYIGDQIGMKVGKKRLSIFGLRPRYSSIIITIITGILIAALSLSILLVTYTSLRQALLNIGTVLTRLENLQEQVEVKDDELTVMQNQIEEKTHEIEIKSDELQELEERYQQTKADYDQAQKNLEQAREDISILEENEKELENKIAELQNERENLENMIVELNQNIDELDERYQQMRDLAGLYGLSYHYYREQDLVYQKGDIIYSDTIIGKNSVEGLRDELDAFLQRANETAREQEVRIDESGQAIRLRDDYELILDDMAEEIQREMGDEQRIIVRLVSRVNVSRNDWLLADFTLNRDLKVFAEEELIVTREIDRESSALNIEEELRSLLTSINEKALQNGLLPDSEGQVGSISYSHFYDLQNEIEEKDTEVQLKVYAVTDIWREYELDSTNLEFVIKPIN